MASEKPNTNPEKFGKGYGDKAYEHAKKERYADKKERWTPQAIKTNELRKEQYERRLKAFKNQPLYTIDALKNKGETYTFKKGDTLYPVLTEHFGMNKRTAFLVMARMLNEVINVDEFTVGDKFTFTKDGDITMTQNGVDINVKDALNESITPQPMEVPVNPIDELYMLKSQVQLDQERQEWDADAAGNKAASGTLPPRP